jgi:hypothetical protein
MAFWTQNKAKLSKSLIITLVFEKNVNIFEENCRKSQKIGPWRRDIVVLSLRSYGSNPTGV